MKQLSSCCLFLYKKWAFERACFPFSVILHRYLSHFLVVKYASNIFFFQVWRLEVPLSFGGSGLILLICVFMYMLEMLGGILIMKFISKIYVENRINHVWRIFLSSQHMILQGFKEFFHCEYKFIAELMFLRIGFKFSILYFI